MLQVETDEKHWIWLAGDAVVLLLFSITFYLREWRIDNLTSRRKEQTGFDKGLPLAAAVWVLYGALVGTRVVIIFRYDLHHSEDIGGLKMAITMTALVSAFFTVGHHHNYESLARRAAIITLVKYFTIDVLDTVDILEILFETNEISEEHGEVLSVGLEIFILVIVVINLIRPAAVYVSLFVDHFASARASLVTKIVKSLFELGFVNVPLLCIRIYIAAEYEDESVSIFLVKNIIGILFAVIEVYDCSFEYSQFCEGKGDFANVQNADHKSSMVKDELSNGAEINEGEIEDERLPAGEINKGLELESHSSHDSADTNIQQ